MIEIERKFLVTSEAFRSEAFQKFKITQGYLNSHPERCVRVRTKGFAGFITVKGKSNKAGASRFEWEKEIPLQEAEALLKLCELGIIEKMRYLINAPSSHLFEVDEFSGENQGLIIAEVELTSEDEAFSKPDWLGKEVTGQKEYYNAHLSQYPFKSWEK